MKGTSAATPEEYVAGLDGWRLPCVLRLREAVRAEARLEETVKWGHLVYLFRGPVLLIRAEPTRVLFGFWRGQRLLDLEPRLRASGKYEMATVELHEADYATIDSVRVLVATACDLNAVLGDPRNAGARR
ncbi:MAG: DUF1801 domain-containing protein [Chloroflexota bacterium]